MEKLTPTKIRYHQPELDTFVKTTCEELLITSKSNGAIYGERNHPELDNENIAAFIEEEFLIGQSAIDEINRKLQYQTSCHHVADHKKSTDGKLREVMNKQVEVKTKQQKNAAQLQGKKQPFSKKAVLFVVACSAILILGDLVFNIKTFEPLGYNFFEAAVISLIFAFLLALLAHFFRRICSWGTTPLQQKIIGAVVIIALTFLFYTLAENRAQLLEIQIAEDTAKKVTISAWPFVVMSLLMFGASVALNDFLFPSPEKRAAMREYQELTVEKERLEKEHAQLKADEAQIEQEHIEVRQMNASILEYASSLEELIMSTVHQGYAIWKKANTMNRKDNGRPKAFDISGYPHQFRTNFYSIIKPNNHEISR